VVEQLTLSRPAAERYELATAEGVRLIFRPAQTPGKYLLARIEDRNANGLHYHYNGYRQAGQEDRLTHIETDDGRLFALGYIERDGDPRLIGVQEWTWAEGQERSEEPQREWLVQYTYSDAGDLIEVQNRAGRVTRQFDYRNHMLVAHKQPGGLESFYSYSLETPSGKVTRNWTNTGIDLRFAYAEGQTTVTDRDGRVTVYRYDADDYHTGTTDALGQTLTKELDADGLPERIIDQAGGERRLFYDGRGNPILIKEPDGSSLQVSYHDDFDLPVAVMDDLGHTTNFAYDARGNLTEHTAADGAVTRYVYDTRGLPIRIIDANGGENRLAYTAAGLLSERTDCSGRRTRYRYDRHGNLIEQIDALDQHTRYGYDAEQRLMRIDHPDGAVEQFRYDPLGRLIGYTDPKGHETTYALDPEGRPTQRTNALGATLHYDYDRHGRLTRLVNENGAAYRFDYDPLDRLKREQGLDGLVTDYRYDPVGNVIEKREHTDGAALRRTRYQRDAAGRLLEKHIAQGDAHSRTRYTYDPIGRLIQARNADSRIDLGYDPLGRILEEITTSPAGEQRIAHALRPPRQPHPHRAARRAQPPLALLRLRAPASDPPRRRGALRLRARRPAPRDQPHPGRAAIAHRLRPARAHPPPVDRAARGGAGPRGQRRRRRHRRRRYRLHPRLQPQAAAPAAPLRLRPGGRAHRHRRHPPRQQPLRLRRPRAHRPQPPAEPGGDLRLRPGAQSAAGHWRRRHRIRQQPGYIKDNRLRVYQDKRYDYDHFGNLTEKRIGSHTRMQFQYDLEHQLTEAEVTRNGVTQTYSYAYDPFGRRIAKQDAFATTAFLWDGNRLLAETRGRQTKTYVYEQQGFVPVAQLDNEQVRYYHTDHLGTPRELTDTEGEIVWEEVYATWGNTLKKVWQARPAEPDQRLDTQPLRFQGQYFDAETGLHYNRFRYYDPDVGRFVSQDPIGLLGGDNLYQYAANPWRVD
jgi:RHS repeat-associated protein